MDLNKLTLKCQEAMQEAEKRARKMKHSEVDGEHLLPAVVNQSDVSSTMPIRAKDHNRHVRTHLGNRY